MTADSGLFPIRADSPVVREFGLEQEVKCSNPTGGAGVGGCLVYSLQ